VGVQTRLVITDQLLNFLRVIPFSERKGYTAIKSWAQHAKSLSVLSNQIAAFLKPTKTSNSHQKVIDRRVIEVDELESEVSFLKLFQGSLFLHNDSLFHKKIFFLRGLTEGSRGSGNNWFFSEILLNSFI